MQRFLLAVAVCAQQPCKDFTYSDTSTRTAILNFCNATGTNTDSDGDPDCTITVTGAVAVVSCNCADDFALPDCQFSLPVNTSLRPDPNNNTSNTCLIEDLLVINQEKNNFDVYGHYVNLNT
ncbi:MAG: hypothetical protein KVP17_004225 [Porospora cf. gigantea B]|nr:MAG: hypothetical protein KVP17_004225 [Porospora cf. gigantea B]